MKMNKIIQKLNEDFPDHEFISNCQLLNKSPSIQLIIDGKEKIIAWNAGDIYNVIKTNVEKYLNVENNGENNEQKND